MTLTVYVDVGDTMRSPWRAGIQRVVCQLVNHLEVADPSLTLVPVVWSPLLRGFRLLTSSERSSLHGDHPPPVAAAPTQRGRSLKSIATSVLRRTRTLDAVKRVVALRRLATTDQWERELAVGELRPGSVLLELDTVWNQPSPVRAKLYQKLRRRGVRLASIVYDLIPIEHPQWFDDSLVLVFDKTLQAQARHSELILAISNHTARSLDSWARQSSIALPPVQVIPLGSDGVVTQSADMPPALVGVAYILVVGTIEPRKNHVTILEAFERIARQHSDVALVVVGRGGWSTDDLVRSLESHPLLGDKLFWLQSVQDAELSALYANATVVAVPSITEGFGLPVIEALRHGVPVASSTGGALPEAGGDLVEYVVPNSSEEWAKALERYFAEPLFRAGQVERIAQFEPIGWTASARSVADALMDHFE